MRKIRFILILVFLVIIFSECKHNDPIQRNIVIVIYPTEENHFDWSNWYGLDVNGWPYKTAIEAYSEIINEINGKGTWESNPYVFVYDYKLFEK